MLTVNSSTNAPITKKITHARFACLCLNKVFRCGQCKTQTANCRLQTADCRLQTADCRLQTADCRLQTADCRLLTGGKMQIEGKMKTADHG